MSSDCIISIKPMLFIGDEFYPFGGWEDFEGYFETIEEAKNKILNTDPLFKWAHIVSNGKIVLKAKTYDELGKKSYWIFEEIA